jgi:hypothetical protein
MQTGISIKFIIASNIEDSILSYRCAILCWVIITIYVQHWLPTHNHLLDERHEVIWNSLRIFTNLATWVSSNWVEIPQQNYSPLWICLINITGYLFKEELKKQMEKALSSVATWSI